MTTEPITWTLDDQEYTTTDEERDGEAALDEYLQSFAAPTPMESPPQYTTVSNDSIMQYDQVNLAQNKGYTAFAKSKKWTSNYKQALLTLTNFTRKIQLPTGSILTIWPDPMLAATEPFLTSIFPIRPKFVTAVELHLDGTPHVHIGYTAGNGIQFKHVCSFKKRMWRDHHIGVDIKTFEHQTPQGWAKICAYVMKSNCITQPEAPIPDMVSKGEPAAAILRAKTLHEAKDLAMSSLNLQVVVHKTKILDHVQDGLEHKLKTTSMLQRLVSFQASGCVRLQDLSKIQIHQLVALAILIKNFDILDQRELNIYAAAPPSQGKTSVAQALFDTNMCIARHSMQGAFIFNDISADVEIFHVEEAMIDRKNVDSLKEFTGSKNMTLDIKHNRVRLDAKRITLWTSNRTIQQFDILELDRNAMLSRFRFNHTIVEDITWPAEINEVIQYINDSKTLHFFGLQTKTFCGPKPTPEAYIGTLQRIAALMPSLSIQAFLPSQVL